VGVGEGQGEQVQQEEPEDGVGWGHWDVEHQLDILSIVQVVGPHLQQIRRMVNYGESSVGADESWPSGWRHLRGPVVGCLAADQGRCIGDEPPGELGSASAGCSGAVLMHDPMLQNSTKTTVRVYGKEDFFESRFDLLDTVELYHLNLEQ
jgi:hypothetical protein